MTVYIVEWTQTQNGGGGFTNVVLAPTTLALKINRVEWSGSTVSVFRNASGSVTGGTTLTPGALRTGAPAATASVKYNYSSVSGTSTFFVATSSSPSPFQPPFSLMVSPGSLFGIVGTASGLSTVIIYYEEQRLQGGF